MPETITRAPAYPADRPLMTTEQLEEVIDAFMADLEELASEGWSGTELVSLVLGVCLKLFAAIEDPADRLPLWRLFAAQIEAQLTPAEEVH